MNVEYVVATVLLVQKNVKVYQTNVAYVTETEFLKAHVTVTETNSTSVEFVEEIILHVKDMVVLIQKLVTMTLQLIQMMVLVGTLRCTTTVTATV